MKASLATLCSGAEGVGVGALAAGLELAWGIEINLALAEMGNANTGNHIKAANLLDCEPTDFERTDGLHISLPCINASQASFNTENRTVRETALDMALANKGIEFIKAIKPAFVTIENVWQWRLFQSWRGGKQCQGLQNALFEAGYWVSVEHVNAADYGVPQTRKRMIVRAVRGGFVPYLPQPSEWIGWYEAIKDLIPTLKESSFADWQNSFVKQATGLDCFMVTGQNAGNSKGYRAGNEPAFTVTASHKASTRFHADGKTYAMNPRCFARLQSFPDWYQLPENNSLAYRGIGNAVPPLMMQRIYEGLITC